MKGITQVFYGTTEEWKAQVHPLYKGVWGVEVKPDKKRIIKIGDGERTWPLLPPIIDEDSQLGDLTALVDQVGTYLSQAQTLQDQIEALQQQITSAQAALADQIQQFEYDKAELEEKITAAGLVDDVSIHRDEDGKLFSSGTVPVSDDSRTSVMSNAPADHGAHLGMTDTDSGIAAGLGVNTDEYAIAKALMFIKSDETNNTCLLFAQNGENRNRPYLLKDKAVPDAVEDLDPEDELLNKAEIQAMIDQAVNGGTA
jgi:hypothetical protein